MREVPRFFINIYDTQLTMLYILCFANINQGIMSFFVHRAQWLWICGMDLSQGSKDTLTIVLLVCLKNLHIPKSKCRYLFSWRRRRKKICFNSYEKHFKTENMACKEERGKCVILNGKNSCLGQIETRWERIRRPKLKYTQEKDIRGEMCSQVREW